jgi:hypothetical protein
MKLPHDLYGRALAAALCRHWDRQVNQVGSHIILHTDMQSITGFRCRITNHCASAHSMAYSEPHRTPQSRT